MFKEHNCPYCRGDEALFWHDSDKNAFIDSNGNMLITLDGHNVEFQVDYCPKCGRPFVHHRLCNGDSIYYSDAESGIIEEGTVYIAVYKEGVLDSFSVNFTNGDFDEFNGSAFGEYFFTDKRKAQMALLKE